MNDLEWPMILHDVLWKVHKSHAVKRGIEYVNSWVNYFIK